MLDGAAMLAAGFVEGPFLWYANRGTGVVLVAMLTLSTVMGVLSTARTGSALWPRFATQTLHRNVSLITVTLLALHVVTAVADEYVDIRWWMAFVPFGQIYKPLPMALGVIALDVLAVITVTSLLRHRMNHRSWRAIHLLAYVSWGVGVLHGVLIGTDAGTTWGMGVTIVSVGAVAAAAVTRLATLAHERRIEAA
jgi:DMSO/TMAO reductase YedYZ heme-binding membrane subunit